MRVMSTQRKAGSGRDHIKESPARRPGIPKGVLKSGVAKRHST
jgi:hypothetical protein